MFSVNLTSCQGLDDALTEVGLHLSAAGLNSTGVVQICIVCFFFFHHFIIDSCSSEVKENR